MRGMRMLSLTVIVVAALSASGQSASETLTEEVVRLRAEVARLRAAQMVVAPHAATERGPVSPSDLNGCADSSSKEPVNIDNLRAEMKLSLSVRAHEKQDGPAQRLQVETWCGTWFDCCYFSHLGPATGLVADCYTILVRYD